jgi:hypothetical protein
MAVLDFGDEDGWSGYVGPGVGIADVRYRLNWLRDNGFNPIELSM